MPFDNIVILAVGALLFVNLVAFFSFWSDKRKAQLGLRRTPESDLLALAFFGGTPGAFLARHMFRHKTRKQPFSTVLYGIAVVQVGLIIGFVIPLPGWL